MNLKRTYWLKTQTISRNLFHVQIECFIIGFSSGKHKSCSYQSCDSRISPPRCQSIWWIWSLSYKHPVSSYQHTRFPNLIMIFKYLGWKFVCATWYGLYYRDNILWPIYLDYLDYFQIISWQHQQASNDHQHGRSMGHQNRPGMYLARLWEDPHKDFARLVACHFQVIHYNDCWLVSEC